MENLKKFILKKDTCGHSLYKVVRFELGIQSPIWNEQIKTVDLYSFNTKFREELNSTIVLAKQQVELKTVKSVVKSKETLIKELKDASLISITEATAFNLEYRRNAAAPVIIGELMQAEEELEAGREKVKRLQKNTKEAREAYRKHLWQEYGLI